MGLQWGQGKNQKVCKKMKINNKPKPIGHSKRQYRERSSEEYRSI